MKKLYRKLKVILKNARVRRNIAYWIIFAVFILSISIFPEYVIATSIFAGMFIQVELFSRWFLCVKPTKNQQQVARLHQTFDDYVLFWVLQNPEFQKAHPQYFKQESNNKQMDSE